MLIFAILFSFAAPVYAAGSSAYGCASSLYTLGLFKGTGSNSDGTPIFALDRAPTRAEAAVMLVRMLGKENEAKNGAYRHPFQDVEDWASPYVGYAYSKGLSNGTTDSTYGGEDTISAPQFITLVLRALGYSSGKDFDWETSHKFSDSIGLTDGSYSSDSLFTRGDTAIIMSGALSQKIKGTGTTLLASLYKNGAVTLEAVKSVGLSSLITVSTAVNELTAAQIYEKCSPAVFFIAVYDSNGNALATGSGFFIDSNGTAVTNFHVIEKAYYAKVKTIDGKIMNVLGVYSVDTVNDLAIIKVDGSGFSYLETADSDKLVTGATVYAIGNPKGLESTLSQGLISHMNRKINGVNFIQTSAQISAGSSGGALIDVYGRVVGITTGQFRDGQNLNLAVPINQTLGMARTNYADISSVSFSKTYPGKEQPYSVSTKAPDFGAYFGLTPYATDKGAGKSSVSYYYYYKSADVAAIDPNAISDYGTLLIKWGLSYTGDYNSEDGKLQGFLYSDGKNLEIFIGVDSSSSTDKYVTVAVRLYSSASSSGSGSSGSGSSGSDSSGSGSSAPSDSSNYPKTQSGYYYNSLVPDFGAYLGSNIYMDLSSNGVYALCYKTSSLPVSGTQAVKDYVDLLKSWGYKYQNNSDTSGDYYAFRSHLVVIGIGTYGGEECVRVYFKRFAYSYSFCKYVPDFGFLMGVKSAYTSVSYTTGYAIYSVSEVDAVEPNALDLYYEVLGNSGFHFVSDYYPNSQSYGKYYSNGSYLVFAGLVNENGMTVYKVSISASY